ncbi:alpha/beta fold hydrolase [Streptomyces sp. PTM05]|uniref:Alpha/beta fold hydrolase n=1 Tax=Streptantibioticus parmotrematis TaxID=2873249 RepID=A0ABS7QY66_9ACTN|nr:alpha/beta fold hydrolase [Streptantibioticus parmotrematis]MBY8886727.1 alpha/beta fold hydrolase [Streptantibioticus parmotrematis]
MSVGERDAALDAETPGALGGRPPGPHARAVVLLLHGGRSEDATPPTRWNLPGLRMIPFGRAVARATAGHGVAIATARYRFRGWNGERADAAVDALRALDELRRLSGGRPVVLVGHSMGGRAALRAAGHPTVRGVVALAPWCPLDEPVTQLRGTRTVLLHCPVDRVTDARGSWELVRRARAEGAEACGIAMPYGGHTMLRRAGDWHRLTAATVAGLLDVAPLPTAVETRWTTGGEDGSGGRLRYEELALGG